jgi:hypothetical protein
MAVPVGYLRSANAVNSSRRRAPLFPPVGLFFGRAPCQAPHGPIHMRPGAAPPPMRPHVPGFPVSRLDLDPSPNEGAIARWASHGKGLRRPFANCLCLCCALTKSNQQTFLCFVCLH